MFVWLARPRQHANERHPPLETQPSDGQLPDNVANKAKHVLDLVKVGRRPHLGVADPTTQDCWGGYPTRTDISHHSKHHATMLFLFQSGAGF